MSIGKISMATRVLLGLSSFVLRLLKEDTQMASLFRGICRGGRWVKAI